MNMDSETLIRGVALLIVLGFVAPFVVTGVPAIIGADQSFVVMSGSMAAEPKPVINPGDVVIVNDVDPTQVTTGDIVTYTTGSETPTTHRVVDVQRQDGQLLFTTKGDNNEDADPQAIQAGQLLGRVMLTIPLIGHVVLFANTTLGFATLVGLPIGLLVLSEAWALVSEESDAGRVGEPEATGEPAGSIIDGTVTVDGRQLRQAALLLAPIVAVTGVVAFRNQTAWTLTLFYASLGLFILVGFLTLRTSDVSVFDSEPDSDRLAGGNTNPNHESTNRSGASTADTHTTDDSGSATGPRPQRTTATGGAGAVGTEDGIYGAPDETAGGSPPANVIVTGRITGDSDTADRLRVDVDSLDPLVEMAHERQRRVIEDPTVSEYFLVTDQVVYRFDPDAASENQISATDSSGAPSGNGSSREAMNDGGSALEGDDAEPRRATATEPSEETQESRSGDSQ